MSYFTKLISMMKPPSVKPIDYDFSEDSSQEDPSSQPSVNTSVKKGPVVAYICIVREKRGIREHATVNFHIDEDSDTGKFTIGTSNTDSYDITFKKGDRKPVTFLVTRHPKNKV